MILLCAVSLCVLGFAYEHDTRSVFADFDAMRQITPVDRILPLVLPDREVLSRTTPVCRRGR